MRSPVWVKEMKMSVKHKNAGHKFCGQGTLNFFPYRAEALLTMALGGGGGDEGEITQGK